MKRIAALLLVAVVAIAGLYLAQRRKHLDAVSPDAVLDAAADFQHDLTRAPMQLTRLSDAEEIRIGDQLAQSYETEFPPLTASTQITQEYVAEVGARIATHASRRLPYHFHLLPDPNFINAFAVPGGHVFIGQGLINQMTTEDELAFVLGHEIEHIDHYHAVERVQIEARLHNLNLDLVAALAQIPISLWQAGYSKDEEFEADREGLRIAAASGYSPQGAILMLNRFLALDREYVIHAETPAGELSQVAIEGLEGYFSSHPEPSERLARIREVIADDRLPMAQPLTPLSDKSKSANIQRP
ncbi:MAG TPA: M48 family metalloprotease [Terracidiphilus sp.]|nr:M48 family metalloprotease [Terracidiphilus sp.]